MALVVGEARIDQRWDHRLNHRHVAHLAVLARIEGALDSQDVAEDGDAAAQSHLLLGGGARAREGRELVEQDIELGGDARVARGAQASAQLWAGSLYAEQVQQRALWVKC